jgi:hypothetical protein
MPKSIGQHWSSSERRRAFAVQAASTSCGCK